MNDDIAPEEIKPNNVDDKINIEEILREGKVIQINPKGYSMYPMFVPGRDSAIIAQTPQTKIRRGDVILYRRDHGILVLHRVWKVSSNEMYMVGDNQTAIEGPLRLDQVRGKLIGFIHNGHKVSVKNPIYLILSRSWLFVRPFRNVFHKILDILYRRK